MKIINASLAACFAALCGCGASPPPAAPTPSVAVTTESPHRGSLPHYVVAYGTATPAINGNTSASVQVDGMVSKIYVTPGEPVHAGQPLVDFRISPAAQSTYDQARTAVRLADEERARTERLVAQQLATQDQLARAIKALSDAQSSLDALDRAYGGKPEQKFTAAFDGIVSALPVTQGSRVAPGTVLVTVTRHGGLLITAGVETALHALLRVNQPVKLTRLSGDPAPIQGTVVRVDEVLNPATRLVDLDVDAAAGAAVLQGESFRLDIGVGTYDGWLVPRDAVLTDGQGAYVYQVAGDKAVRVAVNVVGGDGDSTVVSGPIDTSRRLVTSGNYQLTDGAIVREAAAS